jgi:hypothetical protein
VLSEALERSSTLLLEAALGSIVVIFCPAQLRGKIKARRRETATAKDLEPAHFIKYLFSIGVADSS